MGFLDRLLLYALIAMVLYSLFLLIKTLRVLYQEGEKRVVYGSILFWPLGAVVIYLGTLVPGQYVNIWSGIPFVIFVFVWLTLGFFIESFHRNRTKELEMGVYRQYLKESTPQKRLRFLLIFLAGLLMWVTGFVMALNNIIVEPMVEYVLLFFSLLLIAVGLRGLWRNRKIES